MLSSLSNICDTEYTYRKGKDKTKLLEIAQQHFRKKNGTGELEQGKINIFF